MSGCVRVACGRLALWLLAVGVVSPWLGPGPWVAGQITQCLGTDGCRCTLDDGTVIDVSSLGNVDGTPRFDKVQGLDPYYYSFNPCHPFSQGDCVDTAVCQVTADLLSYFPAGDANTAAWSYDGISAVVYYDSVSPDAFRQSWVTYKCDPSATEPTIVALGEQYLGSYYLEVTSQCACPGACGPGSASVEVTVALSGGSVLLIVFFGLLFVYVAAGMVVNRVGRQASGLELLPNLAFWRALPALVKDGFVFTFSKVRCGRRGGYDEV